MLYLSPRKFVCPLFPKIAPSKKRHRGEDILRGRITLTVSECTPLEYLTFITMHDGYQRVGTVTIQRLDRGVSARYPFFRSITMKSSRYTNSNFVLFVHYLYRNSFYGLYKTNVCC